MEKKLATILMEVILARRVRDQKSHGKESMLREFCMPVLMPLSIASLSFPLSLLVVFPLERNHRWDMNGVWRFYVQQQ
ncbi:unnamed protein product [Prunus brigantina]